MNTEQSRYEIYLGEELGGYAEYRRGTDHIELTHTEVNERFRGQGVAGELVRRALERAREERMAVLPSCPYVQRWLGENPEYLDLVPGDRREEFGLPGG
ncbi:GNAT family N-acetyltransferase [Streptomyces sp. ACA25]|uniref:GNAT family N-acetyltransferase n=1 Tax=Streptomyces sp. ACA25 TaxID=3022596 RepID=UPI002FE009A6